MGLFSSIGSFFGPVGGILGGIGDDILGRSDQQDANSANSAQAETSRAWQENMRGTAYQATVEDLKKAGLNPMLAYSNGATQTPGGVLSAPMQNKGLASSQQQQSSAQSALATAQREGAVAQIDNIKAQTGLVEAQKLKTEAEIPQVTTSTRNIAQQTTNLEKGIEKINEEIRSITASTELARQQGLTETDKRNLMNAQRELADVQKGLAYENITYVEAQTKMQKILSELKFLEIPGAQNQAEFEKSNMGAATPYGRAANTILNGIRKLVK